VTLSSGGQQTAVERYYAIGRAPIAMRNADGTYYLLTDHLGSVVSVLDGSGAQVYEQRYKPFGQPRLSTSGSPTDRGFTGQRELAEAGFADFNARWFDTSLGGFASPDSLIPDPFSPQSLNRYGYVLNNPLRYTDPTGHRACDDFDAGGRCVTAPPAVLSTQTSTTRYTTSTIGKTVTTSVAATGSASGPGLPKLSTSVPPLSAQANAVAQEYDPFYGNPVYYSGSYANDPLLSANYALWRSLPPCTACHVTHDSPFDTGAIPSNALLDASQISRFHALDPLTAAVHFAALGLAASYASTPVGPGFGPGFASEEAATLERAAAETGVSFEEATFWRGEGAPSVFVASGSPVGNITVYDSFFGLTTSDQAIVLQEEWFHAFEGIRVFSRESVSLAEMLAGLFAGGGR
jgi:RHS repeat-associated protein